jgi:NADH dehydrogenase
MKKAGVQHLVHVSALGADPQGPSMYQRSKARGETVLHNAGLQLTILRPSVIFGAEDKFLNLFADLQSVAPFMPLAGSGTRFQPVWVADVARAVAVCLQKQDTIGQTYELCGPDVLTLGELVKLAGQWAGVNEGRGRPVFGLPMWVGWLQAAAMELAPGEPLMSRDNLASMKVDNVATGQLPGLQALGIAAASAAGVAPTYLGHRGPRSKLNRWRAGAGR